VGVFGKRQRAGIARLANTGTRLPGVVRGGRDLCLLLAVLRPSGHEPPTSPPEHDGNGGASADGFIHDDIREERSRRSFRCCIRCRTSG